METLVKAEIDCQPSRLQSTYRVTTRAIVVCPSPWSCYGIYRPTCHVECQFTPGMLNKKGQGDALGAGGQGFESPNSPFVFCRNNIIFRVMNTPGWDAWVAQFTAACGPPPALRHIFPPSHAGPPSLPHLDNNEVVLAVERVAAVGDVCRRPRVHHDDALAQVFHGRRPQTGLPEVQPLLRAAGAKTDT